MVANNRDTRDGIDWQQALYIPLTILAWTAVVLIALWVLTHLIKTVLTLVFSAIVAFALSPLVSLLSRRMPHWLAITFAYLVGFGVILGLLALLVTTAADQLTSLVHALPGYAAQAHRLEPQVIRLLGPFGVTAASFHHAQNQLITSLQGIGGEAAKQSLTILTGVLGTVIDVVLVLILSVYLTANGDRIAQRLRRETRGTQRVHINLLIATVNQVVGGYIRGQLALSALIGVLVGGGMLVLHVRYAVLLGVLAFFMEFIPVIGVLISGSVCVLVALFQGWVLALIVLGYFVVVHVIEGDVVGPRIVGRAVGIHPATALIALVAATELFGFWGALLGAPLAGFLQAIGVAAYRELRGADPNAVLEAVVNPASGEDERQPVSADAGGSSPVPTPESVASPTRPGGSAADKGEG